VDLKEKKVDMASTNQKDTPSRESTLRPLFFSNTRREDVRRRTSIRIEHITRELSVSGGYT